MEYFIVLFGIRYDKHWRQQKKIATQLVASAQHVIQHHQATPQHQTPQIQTPLQPTANATSYANAETPVRSN